MGDNRKKRGTTMDTRGKGRLMALLFALAALTTAWAQKPLVTISDIDVLDLPRIRLRVCADGNASIVKGLDASSFLVRENGSPRPVSVLCPDPLSFNSVVLVLDNSGSMSPVMAKLIEAAGRLVDSLGEGDECAIVSFGRTIQLRQDFTTDRVLLKNVLAGMTAEGGTPLFDASCFAVDLLGARAGNRSAVIITDGEDNLSGSTAEDVVERALHFDARLYTIAFNISPESRRLMESMALATGGRFFTVVRPSDLPAVYERIAADIVDKCCRIEYLTDDCADTLRTVEVTLFAQGDTVSTGTTFVGPARPDSMRLTVEVPPLLEPLESGMAWVYCEPSPSPSLDFTLTFTIVFDPDLLDIDPPIPFTLGTASQNQIVSMTRTGTGRMRFSLSHIRPVEGTTRLVGFPLRGVPADSSRKVRVGIEAADLEGCPVVLRTADDSVMVCRCHRPLPVSIDSLAVAGKGGVIRIPLRIENGLETSLPMLLDARVRIPAETESVSMLDGAVVPHGALEGERLEAGIYRIRTSWPVAPLRERGLLATLLLVIPLEKAPVSYRVSIDSVLLWQRCCPSDSLHEEAVILIDGYCTPLLSRGADRISLAVAPNPVSRRAGPARLTVMVPQGFGGDLLTLDIVNMHGETVRRVCSRPFPPGMSVVAIDVSPLSVGTYVVVAASGSSTAACPFLLLE
ncbi:MAG: VWA domain-containing protein [Bacteroidota bacterium]|nr:VWA domain-containing protein [Bacteroidota bacterium]